MKSVILSIRPNWCEKIISGKKTIEIRKTKPKIETPFKCYIYCTNGETLYRSAYTQHILLTRDKYKTDLTNAGNTVLNGKGRQCVLLCNRQRRK